MTRDEQVVALWLRGELSMQGIGFRFGLTKQRVHQILQRAEAWRERRPAVLSADERRRRSERIKSLIADGRMAVKTNPALPLAVELVRDGLSYGQAAKQLGLTRNMVAGGCYRAGLKTGRTGLSMRTGV